MVRVRRGAFGLDHVRFADPRRAERAIRDWLATHLPGVVVLPVDVPPESRVRTLVLLLSAGRAAVLRVVGRPEGIADDIVDGCRAARVPVSIVRGVAEARAALRRLGMEPEGH